MTQNTICLTLLRYLLMWLYTCSLSGCLTMNNMGIRQIDLTMSFLFKFLQLGRKIIRFDAMIWKRNLVVWRNQLRKSNHTSLIWCFEFGHAFWTGAFFGAQIFHNYNTSKCINFALKLDIYKSILPTIRKVYIF